MSRADAAADLAATQLLDHLESLLHFTVPPHERDRIYLLIASGHIMDPGKLSFDTVGREFAPKAIRLADAYLRAIRDTYGLDFTGDEDFYITLLQDIRYLLDPLRRLISQNRPEHVKQHLSVETELAWLLEDIWVGSRAATCPNGSFSTSLTAPAGAGILSAPSSGIQAPHSHFLPPVTCPSRGQSKERLGAFANYLNVTALLHQREDFYDFGGNRPCPVSRP